MQNILEISVNRARELYSLLQDEESRSIFWARLAYDIDPSAKNSLVLASLRSGLTCKEKKEIEDRYQVVLETARHKKLILYGTGFEGKKIGESLLSAGEDFYGFCGRRASELSNGLMGKPVFSPEWLFQHGEEVYVLISTRLYLHEIHELLHRNMFPEDHVVPFFEPCSDSCLKPQYFEFPAFFQRGSAFIDGGCYNGNDCISFSKMCNGEYSRIFAFEPDLNSFAHCKSIIDKAELHNVDLINAGLSESEGKTTFYQRTDGSSRVANSQGTFIVKSVQEECNTTSIQLVSIDDVTGEQKIGMIKMDIEGAELSALQGAKRTIQRDRPFLAICVYHKVGDVLQIMDFINSLEPDYRFYLRQYSFDYYETVLYAVVSP